MKKFLFTVLALVFLVSTALAGCSKPNNNEGQNESRPEYTENHKISMPERSEKVVENGASSYKILVPDGTASSSDIGIAASELQFFMQEATGVTLPIVEDDEYSAGGQYISIGNTSAKAENNLSVDYDTVDAHGFAIRTVGDDVYIFGAQDTGTLNGVYGYLEHTLHFDFYFTDTYSIDQTQTVPLYDYDITERPDIPVRAGGYGLSTNYNATTRRRLRNTYRSDFLLPATYNGTSSDSHNSLLYLPYEVYGGEGEDQHDAWYDQNKGQGLGAQLCFTAHGLPEEYTALVETAAQAIYDNFDSDSTESYYVAGFSLMDDDDNSWCDCSTCEAVVEEYNAQSATQILFMQDLAAALEQKFRDAEPDDPNDAESVAHAQHMNDLADRFILVFLTYRATESAPYKLDAQGNRYVPEEMKLGSHIAPFYAPIKADYTAPFSESGEYTVLSQWEELSEVMFLWTYNNNFVNSMVPFYSYSYLSELYNIAYESGAYYHYNQAQYYGRNSTGWANLQSYLNSKLGWNIYSDVEELILKFFRGTYGSEGDTMYRIFEEYRAYNQYQTDVLHYEGGIYSNDYTAALWGRPFLLDKIERMYAVRDNLLARGEDVAANNVEIELVSPLYLLIANYQSVVDEETMLQYKKDFKSFVTFYGIEYIGERSSMSDFVATLGV